MKINKNYIIYIAAPIAIFLLGIAFGVLIRDWPYLTFKKEISIAEITNLVLTLFVATYVPIFLSRKISNKRVEKDILIQSCNKLDSELLKLKDLVESAYVKRKTIKREIADTIILRVRTISNMLIALDDNLLEYKSITEVKNVINKLKNNQITFGNDLTLNLRDKKPKVTEDKYLLTETNLNEYSVNISKLIMYLNSA